MRQLFCDEESHYNVLGNPCLASYDVLMTFQPVRKHLLTRFYKFEGYG